MSESTEEGDRFERDLLRAALRHLVERIAESENIWTVPVPGALMCACPGITPGQTMHQAECLVAQAQRVLTKLTELEARARWREHQSV